MHEVGTFEEKWGKCAHSSALQMTASGGKEKKNIYEDTDSDIWVLPYRQIMCRVICS